MKRFRDDVSNSLLRQTFSTVPNLIGIELDVLLDRSLIASNATQLSASQQILLKLNSIDMTGDEGHGLGRRPLNLGFASIGLRAMLSTPTLNDALNVLSRYFQATSSPFALRVTSSAGITQVAFHADGQDSSRAVLLEDIWFSAIYGFLSWFVGRRIPITSAPVMRVDDPYACKLPWAANPPNATSDISVFRMPSSCLGWKRRVRDVEEPLWEALRFWIGGGSLAERGSVISSDVIDEPARVRASDLSGLKSVGERQQSRLRRQHHGASFREMRSDAILAQASELLRTSTMSVDEIARHLGYSEERSFRRFITQRTGETPSQIRRQHSADQSGDQAAIEARIHVLTRKLDF